jgi:hypothetical protein
VTNTEWSQKNTAIDQLVVVALPPLVELEQLTFDAILDKYTSTIVLAAKAIGIDLTDAEVEEIVYRVDGVEEWPEFRLERYAVPC